jgi:glyoxylase-like metal-dependent hydrolase (beta-lactamase superfamily II)
MNGLDIIEYGGEGYKRLVNNAKWTLATLNYAERFDAAHLATLERHNATDETFVLLTGEATLLVGPKAETVRLEPLKYYNVRAGIWHHIHVTPGTRVLIAENADTSLANTDYLDLASGRVFQKRPAFEEVLPNTFLLRVPFGPVWTGIILVRGGKNFLIDSSHLEPEKYLLPALADIGLIPSDIDWLLCTHVHGDHIGGHFTLHEKYGIKVATLDSSADALRDPVKVAIRVRTRFPRNSPPPQSYLKGVEPDKLLAEGELLEGRFRAIATPGHDDDCLVWVDTFTGTAFTGDSLQGNGTPTQGIGFYRDLNAYRTTLAKLRQEVETGNILNLVCGHYYDGIGDVIRGFEAVAEAVKYSADRVDLYGKRIAACVAEGVPVEEEPVTIARKLIGEVGCGMPDALFLALHTVSEHLKDSGVSRNPRIPGKTSNPSKLRDAGDPWWVDVRTAGDFLHLADKTILHSGPPIEYGRMCVLHRRGMVSACLFEGWAKTAAEAEALLERGEVRCEAAMDYATVGSGTGIVTPHVPLLIVEDRETGGRAGVFPGEGRFGGGFCGWGLYSPEIAANLNWMRDELFPPLVALLRERGGFPMRELFAEARRMGDELHSSQRAIDPLFTRAIVPWALECPNAKDLLDYFATTNRFTHNFGQAASRALLLGLEGQGREGFLTAAGGNGVEYGVKFAGSGKWHVAPAPMIEGPYLVEGAKRENQLPWIGDSSITECRGWGGQIRTVNPAHGTPGNGLVINGGMIDRNGGWMGAGSTRMPSSLFSKP